MCGSGCHTLGSFALHVSVFNMGLFSPKPRFFRLKRPQASVLKEIKSRTKDAMMGKIPVTAALKDSVAWKGHFPGKPIVPGVHILEAMKELGDFIISQIEKYGMKSTASST